MKQSVEPNRPRRHVPLFFRHEAKEAIWNGPLVRFGNDMMAFFYELSGRKWVCNHTTIWTHFPVMDKKDNYFINILSGQLKNVL